MRVFTDNTAFAGEYLPEGCEWRLIPVGDIDSSVLKLGLKLLPDRKIFETVTEAPGFWKYMFISEHASHSQYDILIEESRINSDLPEGIICLAGKSVHFHGFHNRPWVSLPGNIHLSVFLKPGRPVENFSAVFMLLSTVSVMETVDSFSRLKDKAMVKWINDVVIEGSKICGVLAYTQSQAENLTGVILGIGLNVRDRPKVIPTSFVPLAACLNDFLGSGEKLNIRDVFERLMDRIEKNYTEVLDGSYKRLLETYKERSVVIGRKVAIWSDSMLTGSGLICKGEVKDIGENLELYIEGASLPIRSGRLVLE